jgi:hypothetical protein
LSNPVQPTFSEMYDIEDEAHRHEAAFQARLVQYTALVATIQQLAAVSLGEEQTK